MAIDYPNPIDIQDVNDEIWFEIINRTITLKEGSSAEDILVQNDANSRNFGFVIQRYFENEDLSTKKIKVHYVNSLSQHDCDELHSIEVVGDNDDVISFMWLVSKEVCVEAGNIEFAIEFYDDNGYDWFTKPTQLSVSQGIYTIGEIDTSSDWYKIFRDSKLDKDQGVENVGKVMIVGEDGMLVPADVPQSDNDFVSYSEKQNLTDAQKELARNNIDAVQGSLATDKITDVKQIVTGNSLVDFVNNTLYQFGIVSFQHDQSWRSPEEKAMARNNIGAISQTELDDAIGSINAIGDYISYSEPQDLTDEQKEMARNNINAVDADLVVSSIREDKQIPNAGAMRDYVDTLTGYLCVRNDKTQNFDDEQKQIARTNIGAISQAELDEAVGSINAIGDYISYSEPQDLTDKQKEMARNNINATDEQDFWNLLEVMEENTVAFGEEIVSLKTRTTTLETDTAELEENLVLPSIYVDERNAVLDKVQSENADLRLVTFTDTHDFSANKYKKYGDLMASGCIDGLVGLGDYQIYSNDITKTETIRKITEIFRYSGRNPNCIYAVGNHDVAYISANSGAPDQSKVLTKKELHDCFNRHLNGSVRFNDADPYGCYYYTDFDASKIRMIVLNTSDIYEPSGILKYKYKESVMMQQPQISWLVNNALDFSDKSNPTEWSVIVCQHAYFDASVGMISDILSAVKNGTSLNKSWTFKRIVDNPDTTEPSNLLPIELAKESYSAVGITITHDNGTFTINGTATTSYSFEIVTKGNDYGQLKAGVKYKIALNKISGTATKLPPQIVLRTRKADGTETAYQNYATGDDFTFTPAEDETLIRFAIGVGAKDYGYTDFVCQPSLTAVEGISDESQIETVISANKDFSEQGAVDVIAVLYGHDHMNTQSVTKGINLIEFISDSAFVDDYYNVSVSGLTAGGYYITNSNGIKMGFTVSSDLPEAVTIGYNNYHAKYNASAPIRVQNGDGATIFSCTAKPSNYQDGMTEITGFIQERTPNTVKTESCSVVSINKDTRTIKIVPYGTGIYREITY